MTTDRWRIRAASVIPGGSSTGSKRPAALYGSRENDARLPTHYERALGCTVWSTDGRQFTDCSMALGAVAIGYGDADVVRAVSEAAASGSVAGLPHKLEVMAAERLADLVPCGEAVRFLRTGAEANAAAVRIARAATGRSLVLGAGYFGWLDWCSDAAGVPDAVRSDFVTIPFDDVVALEQAVAAHATRIAAIIVEPLVHHVASNAWLQAVRTACDTIGAVMIMDEVKTGFRIRTGGVQELTGITPDLATFGKAMANGFPLAAVVGKAGVMEIAARNWISSTAAAESTGLAAACAVFDLYERIDVPARLHTIGQAMQDAVASWLGASPGAGVVAHGPSAMWQLDAANGTQLDDFVLAAALEGVLFKRGAYQFASLAHEGQGIEHIARAMPAIMRALESQTLREEQA